MFFNRRLVSAALFTTVQLASASIRVSTTSGILNGFLTHKNVSTFLGVPYGQPPVGDLRWRTALPVNASGIEVNATQFGPGCGQLLVPGWGSVYADANITPLPLTQSEDCLSLNIWVPRGAKKLPVIMFVYGGGYQSGSSNIPMYAGHHIASTGRAIFVTLNYRMNIWGFPSTTPVGGIDQNPGNTDVRLAIEWVAQNIAQFGGNPAQITIAGQSSGAALVEAQMYVFEKDPIVVGQIVASGSLDSIQAAPSDGVFWNTVADSLGCGNTTDTSQVSVDANYITFTQCSSSARSILDILYAQHLLRCHQGHRSSTTNLLRSLHRWLSDSDQRRISRTRR